MFRNGNRLLNTAILDLQTVLDAIGALPETSSTTVLTPQPVTAVVPDISAVFRNELGAWEPAINTSTTTLASHIALETVGDMVRIANPGHIIEGFSGLTPGEAVHTSPTTPGGFAFVGQETFGPIGGLASNVLAYVLTPTSIIVTQGTAFGSSLPVEPATGILFGDSSVTWGDSTTTFSN